VLELTDISIWRTHRSRRNTQHGLDRMACPTKFGNNLLIRQGRQGLMDEMPSAVRSRDEKG